MRASGGLWCVVWLVWGAVAPLFAVDGDGTYTFRLVVVEDGVVSYPDEVRGVVKNHVPQADAGPDQTMDVLPDQIVLDGSGSYDPDGDSLTYDWSQISGPQVSLDDVHSVTPIFVPVNMGVYVFTLTIHDGLASGTDEVGIVIGNHAPVAHAGSSRYAAREAITLDGSRSFDLDGYGELSFAWQQVSGPTLVLTDADTAHPTVSGFVASGSPQVCTFALTVSDGLLTSEPDTTEVIIVPSIGSRRLTLTSGSFDVNKPTLLVFGGGDCAIGSSMQFGGQWDTSVNWLTTSYDSPYSRYGDVLVAYLSSVAPDYDQLIGTMGFSTGNMPAIDAAIYVNKTYRDRRFAVNRVTFLDTACRAASDYVAEIEEFYANALEGEPFWIANYYHGSKFDRVLNVDFPTPGEHSTPVNWLAMSPYLQDQLFEGLNAGFFISLGGPGRYLCMAEDTSPYWFRWNNTNDLLGFHDAGTYPGTIPQPATLVGPAEGAIVDANGAVLTCEPRPEAVYYDLLLGPDPQQMVYWVSRTPEPPTQALDVFPAETTYWTVRTQDAYGSTIYPEPIPLHAEQVREQTIENLERYRHYVSIQQALDEARDGDTLVVASGPYAYLGCFNFKGKAVTLRSQDPHDADVVAASVLKADGKGTLATFNHDEDAASVLAGLTLVNGAEGIFCDGASPVIQHCVIQGHGGAGLHFFNGSRALIEHCLVQNNEGAGLELVANKAGRVILLNYPTVSHCVISHNRGGGIVGETATVIDCMITDNGE